MKFEAHYYSETGNMESTEYSDNLYSLLRNYSVFWQNDKYKPTLWITEGNVSLRIHDFAFKELTPETYCAYLQERILEADRLLSEIDFASPDELYTNRPDKLEKAVYSLLAKAEIDHTGKLDTKSPSYKKAMRITRSNFPDLFCDLDEDVDLIFKDKKYDYTLFYFNPDSNAGGQIVQCPFSNDQAQRMVGNKDYFDVLAENTQYLSDINTISFFDCIFDIAERMEKGQFIGTFIDDAFSYKDMVKTEEKDELPKTISEFAKTYGNSSSFSKENER